METLPSDNLGSPDSVATLHFSAGAAKKLETLVLPNAAALPPPHPPPRGARRGTTSCM